MVTKLFAILTALMVSIGFVPAAFGESDISAKGFAENKITANGKIVTAGVTPDSPIWPLDVAVDRLSLILTFDSTAKAEKSLEVARERLLEVREMVLKNKLEAASKSEAEHEVMLKVASDSSAKMSRSESKEKIKAEIEEHEEEIRVVKTDVKVRIEIRGNVTAEQKAAIEDFIDKMLSTTNESKVRIEIGIKGDLTAEQRTALEDLLLKFNNSETARIRIKVLANEIAAEAKEEFQSFLSLLQDKRERALERLNDAREEVAELKTEFSASSQTNATLRNSAEILFEEALSHLVRAEIAFNETKYGESFGQATASLRLAENTKLIIGEGEN